MSGTHVSVSYLAQYTRIHEEKRRHEELSHRALNERNLKCEFEHLVNSATIKLLPEFGKEATKVSTRSHVIDLRLGTVLDVEELATVKFNMYNSYTIDIGNN